jgi:hypothetical protein
MHAYPDGAADYIVVDPSPAAFHGWKPGELAWESFQVPAGTRTNMYIGVAIEGKPTRGFPLGSIPR